MSKFAPWPPNSGEKRRTLAIARALLTLGDVTICGFVGPGEDVDSLIAEGFDVQAVPLARSWGKTIPGVLRGRSLSAARFWDPAFANAVTRAAEKSYDVVFVEHVQFQMYSKGLAGATRVVDMHNVESVLAGRVSTTKHGVLRRLYAAESRALAQLERTALDADLVLVVSETDRKALDPAGHQSNIVVVPNGWDPSEVLPTTAAPTVSFVALLSWGPNVDAAVWFTTTVWPLVQSAVPTARLQLVGRDPSAAVRDLASDSVKVTGTVEELQPWYEKTLVAVAPLLAGGGSRLKILEGLAAGRPVVATSIGAEGLEDLIGDGVQVADDPQEMAKTIVALLLDPARAHGLGAQGARAVAERHSWEAAVAPALARLARVKPAGVSK